MIKVRLILSLIFATFLLTSVSASQDSPVAISPGSDMGVASVQQSCPTFSWTAVEGATAYRIEVFESPGDTAPLPHPQIVSLSHPVLIKEIPGTALSWTPSSDEQLRNNGSYLWYVQAIDELGNADWSEGKAFIVDLSAAFAPLESTVADSLEEAGVDKDIISDVLNNVRQKMNEGAAASPDSTTPICVQGMEGTNDTFYGSNAGFSDTPTSSYNSFFGTGAGYTTSTGQQNSFL